MEIVSPMALWIAYIYTEGPNEFGEDEVSFDQWKSFLGLMLYTAHYFNRSILFPLKLKKKNKSMPLVIFVMSCIFNSINGGLNGFYMKNTSFLFDGGVMCVAFGFLLFAVGMYINIKSDEILFSLRKPGETHYSIPKGFLYE